VWWQYIIIAAVLVLGIYAFLVFTGFETRTLSRRTARTAEDMYPGYADSLRKQRRYAKQHGGESANNDGAPPPEPEHTQLPEHGKPVSGGPASGSAGRQ
jgi:hypothetical protein